MAYNKYIGLSRERLEAALRDAQEDDLAGSSVTRVGAGDTMTEQRTDKSNDQRIDQILFALYQIAPEDYSISNITRITRTKAAFRNGYASL